jgi:hypothetical protein
MTPTSESTALVNSEPTMSSLEMVDMINAHRAEQHQKDRLADPEAKKPAILQHKHFLVKVPKVLGEGSDKFSSDLPDTYGRPQPGYRFPKREACLMAMSYSYELQAQTFDKMTALEVQVATLAAPYAPALPAPDHSGELVALMDKHSTIHAAQMAELLSQQARLIALLEHRPAAPALPAPTKPKAVPIQRMTTAHWLERSGLRYTSSQKRQINDAVRAEYHEAGHPFECTKNGWGLFSGARIKLHAERILESQRSLPL